MTKLKLFLIPVLIIALAACSPVRATRGNLVEDFRIAQVTPGVSTQSDVIQAIGSPTTTDPFDPNIWYYMGQKTEKKGIFDPKVKEERIIRVKFDPASRVVTEIAPLDTSRNDIPIVKDTTPASGNELNAVQQMLGNIGKFNKSARPSNPTLPTN